MSLKIFHFSDIHTSANKGENIICNRVESIVGACRQNILPDDDVLFILSGDIAAKGKKEEYKIFNDIFSRVVRAIKEEYNLQVGIVCVPGNHDCDFGTDEDIAVRKKSIDNLIKDGCNPNKDEIDSMIAVQAYYRDFESSFHFERHSQLVNYKDFKLNCGKISVYMINTAWISQVRENVEQRFFPIEQLDDIDNLSSDLVITVFHHPDNWLHPDSRVDFQNRIKTFSDLIIIGHEHRNDSFRVSGSDWSYNLLEGTELQNPANPAGSGFSVYAIDNEFRQITTYNYSWINDRYSRQNSEHVVHFSRNLRRDPKVYTPNEETVKWLNDLELNVQHFEAENIGLKSIFVWPELKVIYDTKSVTERIDSQHYQHITEHPLTLLIGEGTSGKSTMAKVLYDQSICNKNNCLYLKASDITTYMPESLERIVDEAFKKQYSPQDLEDFQQLSKKRKVLLIDNFQDLKFALAKKQAILKYFCMKFKSVILFSNLSIDYGILAADCNKIDINDLAVYEICPMGNQVRKEFITKWFKIGKTYEDDEDGLAGKIEEARKYVDTVLGQYSGILPAFPIQLITILQCQHGTANSQQISRYSYLYGTLVDTSMGKQLKGDEINLYKGVLSKLAFEILADRTIADSIISYSSICACVDVFSKDMLVSLDADIFISVLLETKILKQVGSNVYKFMYPYIYYYFAGSYISSHMGDTLVQNQVDYMCRRLYNEAYGNIMIFVCYFSNNEDIIDQILLNSFELFKDSKPYVFGTEDIVLKEAYDLIDKLTSKQTVGDNKEVDKNQAKYLRTMDELKIQDGTVSDNNDRKELEDDCINEKEVLELNSLYAALKTMSVLGQIIKCYPGTIPGKRKVEIIEEIHDLGMRAANEFLAIFSYMEQDMIEYFVKQVQDKSLSTSAEEISLNVKRIYQQLMLGFVLSMIRTICISFGSELSIPAADKALSTCVSGRIVLHYLNMYCGHLNADEIIREYKNWKTNDDAFAAIALKFLTVNYLKMNRCNYSDRERLCEALGVESREKTTLLLRSTD